jgi:hypothetical protein
MATATIAATSRPVRSPGDAFSGAALAAGAAALFVGTLFYARLTPALGLPALPDERRQALADVLSLGAQKLALAGGFAFFGDLLLFGACMALAQRRRRARSDLHAIGWALIAVSAAIAMVFDSMTAALWRRPWSFPRVQGVVRFSVRRRRHPVRDRLHRDAVGGRPY